MSAAQATSADALSTVVDDIVVLASAGAAPPVDMKVAAARGALSSLSSRWVRTVLQLVSSVVLARLLSPADFGLVALVTVITGLAALFQDLGLTTAVVRARHVTERQQFTLFLCNVALGLMLSVGLFMAAPVLADVYRSPELTDIGRALSPTFLIAALTGQARATLQRDLRFSVISLSEVVIGIAYVIAAIAFAVAGFRYWSLVGATLVSSVAWAAVLLSVSRFRPVRPAPLTSVKTLLIQGMQITGIQATTYLSRTLDVVVVGRFFGAAPVGLYNRASQVVGLAENQLTAAITSVTLPVLSRLQDDADRFNSFLRRAVTGIGYTLVPMFLILSLAAHPLVSVVYGPQWNEAATLLAVLALAGTVRSLLLLVEQAATAVGIMGRQLWMTVVTQLATVGVLVVVAPHGLLPVAIAYVACTAAAVVIGSVWVGRGSVIDLGAVARTFVRPLLVWMPGFVSGRLCVLALDLGSSWAGAATATAIMLAVATIVGATSSKARADARSVLGIVAGARRRRSRARCRPVAFPYRTNGACRRHSVQTRSPTLEHRHEGIDDLRHP